MTTSENILRSARSMVGIRYRHAGHTRHGLDCLGIVVLCMDENGIPHEPVPQGYSRHPDGMLEDHLRRNLDEVSEQRPGDVGLFWVDPVTKVPQHVGIFTEHGGLIHVFTHSRRVVETSKDPFWDRHLVAMFRMRGVE